jgi:hypothetical protein
VGKTARKITRRRSRKKERDKDDCRFSEKSITRIYVRTEGTAKNRIASYGYADLSAFNSQNVASGATLIDLTASPSTSEVLYESLTPPPDTSSKRGGGADVEEDDDFEKEEVSDSDTKKFGELASPYISPYVYKRSFLDATYGIRQIGDSFMIGDSPVDVDENSDVHIKKQVFPTTKGLWELLTRKRVNKKLITAKDLKQYKKILELTNAHLEGYDRDANINVTTGLKFKEVISKLFPSARQKGAELASRQYWVRC